MITEQLQKDLLHEHYQLTQGFQHYDTAYLLLTYGSLYQAKTRLSEIEAQLNYLLQKEKTQIATLAGHQLVIQLLEDDYHYLILVNQQRLTFSKQHFIDFYNVLKSYDDKLAKAEAEKNQEEIFSYQQDLTDFLTQQANQKEEKSNGTT